MIDGYLHLGLPRFQDVEDALSVMDESGIDKAAVCSFDGCPDLATVHRALSVAPDRFVIAGAPVGADRAEMSACITAQLDAGFSGLRITGTDVRERPWILDLVGRAAGFVVVCGGTGGLRAEAPTLLDFLARYPDSAVFGGHFASPARPEVFSDDRRVAELFWHERFAVIFSRQAMFDPATLIPWAHAVLEHTGADRVLWGSESPVLYWRDESMSDALSWIDNLHPTDEQRAAFLGGNAQRMIFDRFHRDPAPLRLPFDPFSRITRRPAPAWPHGLPLDDALAGRLVADWIRSGGGAQGTLGEHLHTLLDRQLP